MKLFTRMEMIALESAAPAAGASMEALMDGAGLALAKIARARIAQDCFLPAHGRRVVLLCGKGNNGGDGFVCAARLTQWGFPCTIILLHGRPQTGLAARAFEGLPAGLPVLEAAQPQAAEVLAQAGLVIDCVYGFSFHGQLDSLSAGVFRLANALACPRLSADLPSGVECDTAQVSPGAFRAHLTVAFTGEKLAHRCYPAMEYCGETVLCQVGIPPQLLAEASANARLTGPDLAAPLLAPPHTQTNKGNQGRLLLVCGSYGMAGACIMAARAALRCGVGLVHIAAEERLYPILAGAVPEAVFTVFEPSGPLEKLEEAIGSALALCSACAFGCGLGALADILCPILFAHCARLGGKPLLLDADALNHCAQSGEKPPQTGKPLVLTPHPGEAARLCKTSVKDIQSRRIKTAQALAKAFGADVLLKGAGTVIASPKGPLALNATGNSGMAKGGSGDVLTGIIGSFLARGAEGFQAAAAGAWLHGAAGDLCREELSARAMLPTDVIEALPVIIKKFER